MLVSVIIPTYNRARTIERTVNSVLNQTWKELEIIIVDDGSTDNTEEVLKVYGDKIRLIRQPNQGPSAARNTGIKAATGGIISFLDSDDIWLPEKTARQVDLLRRTESAGVKCCVCNARMVYATGREITSFSVADLNSESREGIWTNPAEILTTRFLLFNQVVAIRREALDQVGFFRSDLRINEDYDIGLRVALLGAWAFITDPLVVWHGSMETTASTRSGALEQCQVVQNILRELGASAKWGPLFPQALLRRRLRVLKFQINATRLASQPNLLARLSGKIRLQLLRYWDRIYWRLPSTPRMITREL